MPLLDTDIMIDMLRGYTPTVDWVHSLDNEPITGFVVMELYQGCQNKTEQDKVERVLKTCQVVWPSEQACFDASATFAMLHLSSGIGILDMLIGQTSIELNMPLHTFNEKHYRMIPGLQTIQPYVKS